ncbi:helix-turn-helix domain-containing protein [Streptomyces sp. 900105755]
MARKTLPRSLHQDTRSLIAHHLRSVRLKAGTAGKALILAEVSRRSGISTGALSEAENGISLTWRTIQGHIEACAGSKAKAKAALATAKRLWDQLQEETATGTLSEKIQKKASAYWSSVNTLKVPPGLSTHEEGLHALTALREQAGFSVRGLAKAMREHMRISHSTLSNLPSGKAELTPGRLRAILLVCGVPEQQWDTWAKFFAQHDPKERESSFWVLAPTPERLAMVRKDFGEVLEEIVADMVSTQFAEQAEVDLATVHTMCVGGPVTRDVISRVLKAVTTYDVPRTTVKKLTSLAAPLMAATP